MKRNKLITTITVVGTNIIVGILTYIFIDKKEKRIVEAANKKVQKFKQYYQLSNQWLYIKNEKRNIIDNIKEKGYKSIAIYGMGELGNRLYEELRESEIQIKYVIDRYPESNFPDLKFVELNSNIEQVDAIIVTPIYDFEKIKKEINDVVDYSVISLEDILYSI